MKLTSLCLALLTAGLCTKPVETREIYPLRLMEPSVFDVIESPFETLAGVIRREQEFFDSAIRSLRGSHLGFSGFSSIEELPHFEVLDNQEKFHLVVDMPKGITNPSDMEVTYDEHSNMLKVFGKQEVHDEDTGRHFSSQFSHSFSLDPSVEVDQVVATMNDNVLTISAPKKLDKAVNRFPARTIPVTTLLDLEDNKKERMDLPERVTTNLNAAPNERVKPPEPIGTSTSRDPFHVKERIEKARSHQISPDHSSIVTGSTADEAVVNPVAGQKGYKTSELRRRR